MLTVENLQHTIVVAFEGRMLLRYRVTSPLGMPHVDWLGLLHDSEHADPVNLVLAAPFDQRRHAGISFIPIMPTSADAAVSCRASTQPFAEVHDDGSISFGHTLEWADSDGSPRVTEARRIHVEAPMLGRYRVDFSSTLRSTGDRVELRPSNAPPDADGLFIRLTRAMRAHAGGDPANSSHPGWIHLSGEMDGLDANGEPLSAGLLLSKHPDTPMVLAVDTDDPPAWMSAGWVPAGVTLAAESTPTLRCGLLVHCGRLTELDIAHASTAFAGAGC